ncbi:ATP-binding protein [Streptomyces corynorhini]|uniref:ATP-binding protein n=1 Tax=Streptomyces corynorhini TaxID=2282652 RepID=A0A370B8M6_9ACTN|nr:ATP-binding protein [Streptomyces corynorhini]RDG36719.1 ATP-binding protein [Streptomyces corynorhini]
MKQSAVKTIGAAALGAAFAATAAGSASAAPSLPDTGATLDTLGVVTQTLPLETVAEKLPAPTSEVVTTGRSVLNGVQKTTQSGPKANAAKAADPLSGLLGGLPVNGLAKGGNGLNGLPLG